MDWKFLFFSSDGRISRQQFWIGALILLGAGVVASWIPLVNVIAFFVSIYVWACLYAKRLHDMGKSGWLTALPVALFILAAMLAAAMVGGLAASGAFNTHDITPGAAIGVGMTGVLFGLVMLVALAFALWVGLTPGEPGANRFGQPPTPDPVPEIRPDAPQG